MILKPLIFASALYLLFSDKALSEEKQSNSQCRCCDVGRFYAPWLKDLAKPPIRQSLGNAELKITTKSDKAQEYFNQGLNCLHGFWEVEAYRYFLAAIEEDPECAMAYWGVCMSLPGKISEAQKERDAAFEKAQQLSVNISEHEKLYITVLWKLLNNGSNAACIPLQQITEEFPKDLNAIGFLAYWSQKGYTPEGLPKEKTTNSIKILEKGLAINPEHVGIIHYYVHILEQGPDFMKAMPHVKKLTSKGKDISHLVHMPGHIYFLAGDYANACSAFQQCYDTEVNYFAEEKITPNDLPNYTHNMHFWAKTEAERGNYNEALRVAKLLKKTLPSPSRKNTTVSQNNYVSSTLEAYIHMRFQEYEKASKSLDYNKYTIKSSLHHYLKFIKHYCDMKAEMNNTADWNKVYEISEEMEATWDKFQQTRGIVQSATREDIRAAAIMGIYNEAAKLWLFNVDKNKAIDLSLAEILLKKESEMFYAEPPMLVCPLAEEIGWLCLKFGEYEKAITYFNSALKKRANSGHIYSGIIESYEKIGNNEKVQKYKKLQKATWKEYPSAD